MPHTKSTEEIILAVFKTLGLGAEKVKMDSDTHTITGYKVGVVIRLDIKERKQGGK